jgi:hypothetical protein
MIADMEGWEEFLYDTIEKKVRVRGQIRDKIIQYDCPAKNENAF